MLLAQASDNQSGAEKNERRDSSKQTNSAVPFDASRKKATAKTSMSPHERLDYWSKFFDTTVRPEIVHDVVFDLFQNRKHEDVVVCIEQAILHGQIQPWMYQVLALSMQATGRPKDQIARVMLSSQDVILNDALSMTRLAAYLANFEQNDRAIELYRQAATLDPSRPEPYILALELAARTKNYPAVVWSAPEVLAYSWGKDRERLNRLAEQSAIEAEAALIKSGDFAKAAQLQNEMRRARRLDLAIRLEWNGQGDLDLEVREPGGTVCSNQNPMTKGGGIFLRDGFGPIQEHCYEEYLCPQGFSGEYVVTVKHFSGEIVGKRARLTIVRNRGTDDEDSISETIMLGTNDQTVRLSLTSGRRQQAKIEDRALKVGGKGMQPQQSVLSQIGAGGGAGIGQTGGRTSGVGYSPIVTQFNEGVQLGVLAVVSGDRRYVRVSLNPSFSSITDVFSFGFAR